MSPSAIAITAAVEGDLDHVVVERLILELGANAGPVHGRAGRSNLMANLDGYNRAAQFAPWLVLVDLDTDDCAPKLRDDALPSPSQFMTFRIAVREVESWILADRERVASFLAIGQPSIPLDPDTLLEPKRKIVDLARRSRRSAIKRDLVPREGSGRATGDLYNTRMMEFVQDGVSGWRPEVARQNSDSLDRAIRAIEALLASI